MAKSNDWAISGDWEYVWVMCSDRREREIGEAVREAVREAEGLVRGKVSVLVGYGRVRGCVSDGG